MGLYNSFYTEDIYVIHTGSAPLLKFLLNKTYFVNYASQAYLLKFLVLG